MLFLPMFAAIMLSHSFQETEQIINNEIEKAQKQIVDGEYVVHETFMKELYSKYGKR